MGAAIAAVDPSQHPDRPESVVLALVLLLAHTVIGFALALPLMKLAAPGSPRRRVLTERAAGLSQPGAGRLP